MCLWRAQTTICVAGPSIPPMRTMHHVGQHTLSQIAAAIPSSMNRMKLVKFSDRYPKECMTTHTHTIDVLLPPDTCYLCRPSARCLQQQPSLPQQLEPQPLAALSKQKHTAASPASHPPNPTPCPHPSPTTRHTVTVAVTATAGSAVTTAVLAGTTVVLAATTVPLVETALTEATAGSAGTGTTVCSSAATTVPTAVSEATTEPMALTLATRRQKASQAKL